MQIPRMTNIFTEIEAEKSVTIDTRELTSKDWAFEESIKQKCIELESRGIKTLLITQ